MIIFILIAIGILIPIILIAWELYKAPLLIEEDRILPEK